MAKNDDLSASLPSADIEELAKASGITAGRFPQTKEEADAVETVLANEFDKLSLNEQERILFDIHGVAEVEPEDPQVVEAKLQELEDELSKIRDKDAYDLAHRMNPHYTTSIRLMFLRREQFDAPASAKLMVQHFEVKRKLFGDGDVLGRDVRQSDLNAADKRMLESGFLQILPERDAAGRTILCLVSAQVCHFPLDGWDANGDFRATWYICMKALIDEETQRRGVVFVIINTVEFQSSPEHLQGMVSVLTSIPQRMLGGHYCYDNPAFRPHATGFHLFAGGSHRNHLRLHCGSKADIDFELMTFGIPTDFIPVDEHGQCNTVLHRELLIRWRSQEQQLSTSGIAQIGSEEVMDPNVMVPRRFDVLFGKSTMARKHTGTLRAQILVEMNYEAYESAGKFEKTAVAERIIRIIHESGGRFLKEDDEGFWKVADDTEARNKVAHWFRHARRKKVSSSPTEGSPADIPAAGLEPSPTSQSATKRKGPD